MFGYTAYQFSCVAPVALMFFVGAAEPHHSGIR